jgi:putative MATE family efflux protein
MRHQHDSEIVRLALPAFGALIAEPLFLLADSAIVGHLGTSELAGLGIAGTIIATCVSLCVFLAYGTTSAVARRLGAGDVPGALRFGVDGLWLGGLLGALLAVLGILLGSTVVGLFNPAPDARHQALLYLRIAVLGLPAALGVMATTGVLRGLQDTKTPLVVAVVANVANIGLNFALVYGLDLGISGSALGTTLAQWCAAAAYLVVVLRRVNALGVSVGPSIAGMRRCFAASVPLLVRNVSLRIVVTSSAVVAAHLGSSEIAAHQVTFNVYNTLALGLDAIAIAGQALVGRYLGGGDVSGAREATRRMIEWSIGMGVVAGLLLLAGRGPLAAVFTEDPQVRHLLRGVFVVLAVMQPVAGWVFALDGVLIGAGDMRYIALAQVVTVIAFVPLAAAVLAFDLGLTGLWWALAGWVLVRLLVMAWRQRGDGWVVVGATR